VAGPKFGAKTVGRADKFARVVITLALGRVDALRRSLTVSNTGLFYCESVVNGGVRKLDTAPIRE
jgi:hypothetical protein